MLAGQVGPFIVFSRIGSQFAGCGRLLWWLNCSEKVWRRGTSWCWFRRWSQSPAMLSSWGGHTAQTAAHLLLLLLAGARVALVAVAGVAVPAAGPGPLLPRPLPRPPAPPAFAAVAAPAPAPQLQGGGAVARLGRGRHALNVHALHLHLLLVFHPPVLEPDLYLALRQAQHGRHLDTSGECIVSITVLFTVFIL